MFPGGGDGIFLCVDEKSNFREDNFSKAVAQVADTASSGPGQKGRRGGKKDVKGQSDLFKIIKMVFDIIGDY